MDSMNRDLEAAPAATRTTTFSSSTDDPIKQWESALNVVIAANRFKDRSPVATAPPLDQDMGQNTSDYEEISSKEQNLLAHVPEQADTSDEHPSNYDFKLAYLKIVHGGLVQQLNAYGIVFTLLATVTSVSILQPPGSFDGDHGHIRPSKLVACYLLFASLSFLLACTGLFAVIVGQASLYRPLFFPKPQIQPALIRELTPQRGFDKVSTLKSIIVDNLSRVRRLKTYLGFSLALGMTAYVCGAFAILGPGMRNLCMAAGTVGVSIVILLMEAAMTWRGPALPDDTLGRLQHIIH